MAPKSKCVRTRYVMPRSGDTAVEINKELLADNEFDYLLILLLMVVTFSAH